MSSQKVSIVVELIGEKYQCPCCHSICPIYDRRSDHRKWRHLDTMQFETIIESEIPRVKCDEHGVKSIEIPWAGKHSRFTLLFESFAIRVLQSARSVEEARKLVRLNWHQLEAIKQRAVERGLKRRKATAIPYIGIDEKSHRKGHDYVTLMTDLNGSRVLDVVEARTQEACETLITQALSARQRRWVKAVAIDMWPAYISGIRSQLPDSAIVHDRFHISKHLNEAVDQVRRQEHAQLKAQGDYRLNRTRYRWLANHTEQQIDEQFSTLKNSQLNDSV
jgi:transposase